MGEWRTGRARRRAQDFDAFVAGAAGRLLHVCALLTTEPLAGGESATADSAGATSARSVDGERGTGPAAHELLLHALARTYAVWDSTHDEDPYIRTRREVITHFAHGAWRYRRPHGGVLSRLSPQERVVVVLRLYEGVAEEQVAAMMGLSEERVRAVCSRSISLLRPVQYQEAR